MVVYYKLLEFKKGLHQRILLVQDVVILANTLQSTEHYQYECLFFITRSNVMFTYYKTWLHDLRISRSALLLYVHYRRISRSALLLYVHYRRISRSALLLYVIRPQCIILQL